MEKLYKPANRLNMQKLHAMRNVTGPTIGDRNTNVDYDIVVPKRTPHMDTKPAEGHEAPRNSFEVVEQLHELSVQNEFRWEDIPFAVEYPLVSMQLPKPNYTAAKIHRSFSRNKSPGPIARLMGLEAMPGASLKSELVGCAYNNETLHKSAEDHVINGPFMPAPQRERLKSEDNLPLEELSFRDHPQEKQLQQFKKTFEEAHQVIQEKSRVHLVKPLSAEISADSNWLEACAALDKSKEVLDTLYFLQSNKKFFLKLLEGPQEATYKALLPNPQDQGRMLSHMYANKDYGEKVSQTAVERSRELYSRSFSSQTNRGKNLNTQLVANEMAHTELRSSRLISDNVHMRTCPMDSKLGFENLQITESPEAYHSRPRTPLMKSKGKSSSQTRVAAPKSNPDKHRFPKFFSSPTHPQSKKAETTLGQQSCGLKDFKSKSQKEKLELKTMSRTKIEDVQKEPRKIAKEIVRRVKDAVKRELNKSRGSYKDSTSKTCNTTADDVFARQSDGCDRNKQMLPSSSSKNVHKLLNRVSSSLPSSPLRSKSVEAGVSNGRKDLRSAIAGKSKDGRLLSQQGKILSHSMSNSRTHNYLFDSKMALQEVVRSSSKSCKVLNREIKDCESMEERTSSLQIAFMRSRSLPSSATKCDEYEIQMRGSHRTVDWPCTDKRESDLKLKKEHNSPTISSKGKFAGFKLNLKMSKRKTVPPEPAALKEKIPIQRNLADSFEPFAKGCNDPRCHLEKCSTSSSLVDFRGNISITDNTGSLSDFPNSVSLKSCTDTMNMKESSRNYDLAFEELLPELTPSENCLSAKSVEKKDGSKIDENVQLSSTSQRLPGSLSLHTSNDLNEIAEVGIEKVEQHSPVSVLESPFIEIRDPPSDLQDLCLHFNLLKLDGDGIQKSAEGSDKSVISPEDSKKTVADCLLSEPKQQTPKCSITIPESLDTTHECREDMLCPPGKEHHLMYVTKIFRFSGLLKEHKEHEPTRCLPDHVLDQSIFEKIEEHVSQESNKFSEPQEHLSILEKYLLFDVVNEHVTAKLKPQSNWILPISRSNYSSTAVITSGKKLMQDTWEEICSYMDKQSSYYSLVETCKLGKLSDWMQLDEQVARIVELLEKYILRDMITDTVLSV